MKFISFSSYSVLDNRPDCNNEVSGPVVLVTDIGESTIKEITALNLIGGGPPSISFGFLAGNGSKYIL